MSENGAEVWQLLIFKVAVYGKQEECYTIYPGRTILL